MYTQNWIKECHHESKLQKLLVNLAEREIIKATLRKQAGLFSTTLAKLRDNQEITLSVMLQLRMC